MLFQTLTSDKPMQLKKIYIDSETCGLAGIMVLFQYAEEDGNIILYHIWKEKISKTLELFKYICENCVVGFNLTFDWFHISKIVTTWTLALEKLGDIVPENYITEIAILEEQARFLNLCVKPKGAFDLLLHSRKNEFQTLMRRSPVRIRRIPTALALPLCNELNKTMSLDPIFFAKKKDSEKWRILDIPDRVDLKDLELSFSPSGKLKSLAKFVLKKENILEFSNINKVMQPEEIKYAPYALALATKGQDGRLFWNGAWPDKIAWHIKHWQTDQDAIKYGTDDIVYTRDLYKYFKEPALNDNDSILACMVASVRWHGYALDLKKLQNLREAAILKSKMAPTAPAAVKEYLLPHLNPTERLILKNKDSDNLSTKAILLEELVKWDNHPVQSYAKKVLAARGATKEIELYDKLLLARRFHPSFNIIGTLSSRMSGTDDLNPQAIDHNKEVRACFILKDSGESLSGGDFDSQEVTIAEAAYKDENLRADLLSGKKIHALFGAALFPEYTYEQVLESKGTDNDIYDKGKKGVFTIFYGGNESTLQNRLGVPIEEAQEGYRRLIQKYPGMGKSRAEIFNMFCSMRQPDGIGTKVEWHEPAEYIETLFGFRRYFTLENYVCRNLFKLANNPPKAWRNLKIKIVRRDREQTINGAVQSALYAATFNLQASNMRAAANHVIQGSGAYCTKFIECKIWELQSVGFSPWIVRPFNIHDEIPCPTAKGCENAVEEAVSNAIKELSNTITLIKLPWKRDSENWADLKE